jgi:hypothetical protein
MQGALDRRDQAQIELLLGLGLTFALCNVDVLVSWEEWRLLKFCCNRGFDLNQEPAGGSLPALIKALIAGNVAAIKRLTELGAILPASWLGKYERAWLVPVLGSASRPAPTSFSQLLELQPDLSGCALAVEAELGREFRRRAVLETLLSHGARPGNPVEAFRGTCVGSCALLEILLRHLPLPAEVRTEALQAAIDAGSRELVARLLELGATFEGCVIRDSMFGHGHSFLAFLTRLGLPDPIANGSAGALLERALVLGLDEWVAALSKAGAVLDVAGVSRVLVERLRDLECSVIGRVAKLVGDDWSALDLGDVWDGVTDQLIGAGRGAWSSTRDIPNRLLKGFNCLRRLAYFHAPIKRTPLHKGEQNSPECFASLNTLVTLEAGPALIRQLIDSGLDMSRHAYDLGVFAEFGGLDGLTKEQVREAISVFKGATLWHCGTTTEGNVAVPYSNAFAMVVAKAPLTTPDFVTFLMTIVPASVVIAGPGRPLQLCMRLGKWGLAASFFRAGVNLVDRDDKSDWTEAVARIQSWKDCRGLAPIEFVAKSTRSFPGRFSWRRFGRVRD